MSNKKGQKGHGVRWGKSGRGKWMKRQLSKARRRFAKGLGKEPVHWETEVNYKGY